MQIRLAIIKLTRTIFSILILMQKNGFSLDNITVVIVTILLLLTEKLPAPVIVLLAIAAGFIF